MSHDDQHEPAPLRADARRMLATWREADQMPRATKQRVWKRLRGERKRTAAPSQRSAAWVWAVAIAAAVLLVWWGAASAIRSARDQVVPAAEQAVDDHVPQHDERTASEAPRSGMPDVPTPPEVRPAPVPLQSPTIAEPAQPRESAPRPRHVPTPRELDAPEAPAVPTTTLARERDVIARAWSALADGDPGSALQRAAEHELAFPDGLLAPERRAIAVIARCKRGDKGAAARAQEWLNAQPRSPLAGRVRTACIATSP